MEIKNYYTAVREAVAKLHEKDGFCRNDADVAEVRERFEKLPEVQKEFMLLSRARGERVIAEAFVLSAQDAERAIELNDLVARGVDNPEVFNSDQQIERNLSGEGWGLGVKADGRLVAIVILSTIPEDWTKLTANSPLSHIPPEEGAIRDIVVVHRDYRSNGLQRRLIELAASCLPLKRKHLVSTISPQNPASLISALSAGCHVIHWDRFYGGVERFLTYLKVDQDDPVKIRALPMLVPLSNSHINRAMLESGYRAIGVEQSEQGLMLRYGIQRIGRLKNLKKQGAAK